MIKFLNTDSPTVVFGPPDDRMEVTILSTGWAAWLIPVLSTMRLLKFKAEWRRVITKASTGMLTGGS